SVEKIGPSRICLVRAEAGDGAGLAEAANVGMGAVWSLTRRSSPEGVRSSAWTESVLGRRRAAAVVSPTRRDIARSRARPQSMVSRTSLSFSHEPARARLHALARELANPRHLPR